MSIYDPTDLGWPTVRMHSYIPEADKITGPWKLVTYIKDFGKQGCFLNFPSKFIIDDGRNIKISLNLRAAAVASFRLR